MYTPAFDRIIFSLDLVDREDFHEKHQSEDILLLVLFKRKSCKRATDRSVQIQRSQHSHTLLPNYLCRMSAAQWTVTRLLLICLFDLISGWMCFAFAKAVHCAGPPVIDTDLE